MPHWLASNKQLCLAFLLNDALGIPLPCLGRKAVICLPLINLYFRRDDNWVSPKDHGSGVRRLHVVPAPVTSQPVALGKSQSPLGPIFSPVSGAVEGISKVSSCPHGLGLQEDPPSFFQILQFYEFCLAPPQYLSLSSSKLECFADQHSPRKGFCISQKIRDECCITKSWQPTYNALYPISLRKIKMKHHKGNLWGLSNSRFYGQFKFGLVSMPKLKLLTLMVYPWSLRNLTSLIKQLLSFYHA